MPPESRSSVVNRLDNALLSLEWLSNGKTARLEKRIHGGEQNGLHLLRDKTPFDFFLAKVVDLCEEVESRAEQERRREQKPMTPLEEDYWFRESYEGKDYRTVADRENKEPDEIWRRRERMGLNPKDGTPMERAA